MADAVEMEARIAYDQELASLAAQRNDLKDMQSRAKDLIGLLTLAGTFLGTFGKDAVGGLLVELQARGGWQVVVFIALPAITLLCCLWTMTPSAHWAFNLDGGYISAEMKSRAADVGFASTARVLIAYAAVLKGFYIVNASRLRLRKWALWTAGAALAATIAQIGYLVVS